MAVNYIANTNLIMMVLIIATRIYNEDTNSIRESLQQDQNNLVCNALNRLAKLMTDIIISGYQTKHKFLVGNKANYVKTDLSLLYDVTNNNAKKH